MTAACAERERSLVTRLLAGMALQFEQAWVVCASLFEGCQGVHCPAPCCWVVLPLKARCGLAVDPVVAVVVAIAALPLSVAVMAANEGIAVSVAVVLARCED